MSYKIETSFAFPIIRINTIIKSTKVEKPSGVSYLLLVLINENKDKKALLAETLNICGVPEDLYSVFADELQNLINLEILDVKDYNYDKRYFEEYIINNFKFTSKGKKIFLEESIPLGHDEEIKQPVFFNPALNRLYIDENNHLRSSKQSVLDNNFFKNIKIPDEIKLEDFLNTQKSRQISIKTEEIILDVKIQNIDQGFETFDFFINMNEDDTITFDFLDKRLKKYFEKYYNKEMITEGILVKNKFKFYVPTKYHSKLSDHLPIINIYRPKDAEKCYSRIAHLNVFKKGYESINNKLSYENVDVLNNAYKNSAFLKIISLEKGYSFIPTYLTFNSDIFGDITLSVLIEKELSKESIKKVFDDVVKLFTVYDSNKENPYNYKNLIELCKLDSSNKMIFNKIDEFVNIDLEESILLLEKIKDDSIGNPKIYEYIKNKSIELYKTLFNSVNLDNLERYLILTNWIVRMNKMEEIKHLDLIFNNFKINNDADKIKTFNILEKLNYKPKNIIMFIKDIPQLFLNNKKIDNVFANNIKLLFNQKENLQNLTNIKNLSNYVLEDQIDRDLYNKTYNSFSKTYNSMLFLKDYLKEEFIELERYNTVFKNLNELYQKEEEAALNPEKIDKKFLINIINTSNILTSIAYVFIKLSHIAKTKYAHEGDIFDFIDKLYKNKKISKTELNLFHRFRIYRNDLEHANNQRVDLTKDELKETAKIIFELEEQKDE